MPGNLERHKIRLIVRLNHKEPPHRVLQIPQDSSLAVSGAHGRASNRIAAGARGRFARSAKAERPPRRLPWGGRFSGSMPMGLATTPARCSRPSTRCAKGRAAESSSFRRGGTVGPDGLCLARHPPDWVRPSQTPVDPRGEHARLSGRNGPVHDLISPTSRGRRAGRSWTATRGRSIR